MRRNLPSIYAVWWSIFWRLVTSFFHLIDLFCIGGNAIFYLQKVSSPLYLGLLLYNWVAGHSVVRRPCGCSAFLGFVTLVSFPKHLKSNCLNLFYALNSCNFVTLLHIQTQIIGLGKKGLKCCTKNTVSTGSTLAAAKVNEKYHFIPDFSNFLDVDFPQAAPHLD